jgi:hypothetical protein
MNSWDPFATGRREQPEHVVAQALRKACVGIIDLDPDGDQGQRDTVQAPPPSVDDMIRRAVGIDVQRDRHGRRVPEIGD